MFQIRNTYGEIVKECDTPREARIAAIYESVEHARVEILQDGEVLAVATTARTEQPPDCR